MNFLGATDAAKKAAKKLFKEHMNHSMKVYLVTRPRSIPRIDWDESLVEVYCDESIASKQASDGHQVRTAELRWHDADHFEGKEGE